MLHGFLKTPWKAMNKSLQKSAGIYDTRGNCSRGKSKNVLAGTVRPQEGREGMAPGRGLQLLSRAKLNRCSWPGMNAAFS